MSDGMEEYRVVRYEHGRAIFGAIPVPELLALMHVWNPDKELHVDALISQKLGAVFAFGRPEALQRWRKELSIERGVLNDPLGIEGEREGYLYEGPPPEKVRGK